MNGPIFFGPGAGTPKSRFDSSTGRFDVLYVSLRFAGAFCETVLRNPEVSLIDPAALRTRSHTPLRPSRRLRLAKLLGPGLQRLGLDLAIVAGPYSPAQAWADALFDHASQVDGIAYPSRFDQSVVNIALFENIAPFERPYLRIEVAGPSQSLQRHPEVAKILDRYGKGIA